MKLYLDLETYSETSLQNGTFNYADDAEVMLCQYAIDDGEVAVWDLTRGESMPNDLMEAVYLSDMPIVIHNSFFDRTVAIATELFPGADITPTRIIDTMVQALAHGLPGKLDTLCTVFSLDESLAKMKEGRALVMFFCKPLGTVRRTEKTHPEKWAAFRAYGISDITSMRELHRLMPKWNYPGLNFPAQPSTQHRQWVLDQRINDRGFAVDVELAHCAVDAAADEKENLNEKTFAQTDGEVAAATQRDELLRYVLKSWGIDLPDMRADTLQRRVEDESLPKELRELLATRIASSRNSAAKYKALIRNVASDDRLHGSLQFCGAATTGRYSGRVFQPQNLMRPTMKPYAIEEAISAIKSGAAPLVYDNMAEVLGNCVRGVIVAPRGRKLLVSDLSSIEGRGLAWLAREEYILENYRDTDAGVINYDSYMLAYTAVFGGDPATVTKAQRTIGKPIELACLAGDTKVVTNHGVKFITDVTTDDLLWDGLQWVQHQGLIAKGKKETLPLDGLNVTAEHLITTKQTWMQAQQLVSNQAYLQSALAVGTESLQRLKAQEGELQYNALVAQSHTKCSITTCVKDAQPDATIAPNLHLQNGVKTTGVTKISSLVLNIVGACSIALQHVSIVAKMKNLVNIKPMVEEVFGFFQTGLMAFKANVYFSLTSVLSPVGISQHSNSTGKIITKDTSLKIYGSLQSKKMVKINVQSDSFKQESKSLKPVYDIANAGPLNRFTVLTDTGALIVHNCGYGGGVAAFLTFAMTYHLDLQATANSVWANGNQSHLQECVSKYAWAKKQGYHAGLSEEMYAAFEYVKQKWRAARPATVELWDELKHGFEMAVAYEKKNFQAGPVIFRRDGQWLRLRLPSGRCLTFLQAKADSGGLSYMGLNRYTRKWGRVSTHGGKLAGLVTQAFACDILGAGLEDLEAAEYLPVLSIHDEVLCETPDTDDFQLDAMVGMMTAPRSWAVGLPLSADGFETYRYRKAD